jgi:hypothetical protein
MGKFLANRIYDVYTMEINGKPGYVCNTDIKNGDRTGLLKRQFESGKKK